MAVEVEVVGNGKFKGSRSNILKYSVNEDATPTRPGDFSGGTGTVDFSASEVTGYKGSTLLMNDTINLSDTGSGTTTGKVDSLTIENGVVSVSGLSRLELLNASANIPLVDGTLDSVVRQILALAGITTGIVIDTAIQSTPVRGRGGEKSYWLFLKELCAAYQVEISLVSNNVVVRGLRQRSAFTGKIESQSYSVGNGDLARNIEVAYYNYQTISSALVYPYGGWTSDVDVFQVDASESRTINIPVDVNIASLSQPTMVSSVARFMNVAVIRIDCSAEARLPAASKAADCAAALELMNGLSIVVPKSVEVLLAGTPVGTITVLRVNPVPEPIRRKLE